MIDDEIENKLVKLTFIINIRKLLIDPGFKYDKLNFKCKHFDKVEDFNNTYISDFSISIKSLNGTKTYYLHNNTLTTEIIQKYYSCKIADTDICNIILHLDTLKTHSDEFNNLIIVLSLFINGQECNKLSKSNNILCLNQFITNTYSHIKSATD